MYIVIVTVIRNTTAAAWIFIQYPPRQSLQYIGMSKRSTMCTCMDQAWRKPWHGPAKKLTSLAQNEEYMQYLTAFALYVIWCGCIFNFFLYSTVTLVPLLDAILTFVTSCNYYRARVNLLIHNLSFLYCNISNILYFRSFGCKCMVVQCSFKWILWFSWISSRKG